MKELDSKRAFELTLLAATAAQAATSPLAQYSWHVVHTVGYAAYRATAYRASSSIGGRFAAVGMPRPMPAYASETTRPRDAT